VSGFPPTVTAILLSYNCADVVADAVRSVLSQDCEPMDVIVSDDASTDDTYEALRREVAEYAGPHQVRLRRRDTNSGSKSAHLNDVFPLASGRFVVSFDGDDVAERHRVRRILEVFRSDEQVTAVFSDYAYLNETGGAGQRRGVRHPPPGSDAGRWFARVDAFASGATLAVRRDVVESFGPLDPAINEDVLLPFRASLLGDVCFVDFVILIGLANWGSPDPTNWMRCAGSPGTRWRRRRRGPGWSVLRCANASPALPGHFVPVSIGRMFGRACFWPWRRRRI
jgi:cellulose synthase/poly-beta-1,6-N-acetylglucosamine synthase-like glycosyltransferase